MTFKFRYFDKIVGFFVLFGLLCLLLIVILMGSEQRWFEGTVQLHTFFDRGEDLANGMDVKIKGITVGKATRIALNEKNRIRVDFKIYNQFLDRVKSDSSILLETPSPLGGGYLSVALGKSVTTVTDGQFLPSEHEEYVKQLLASKQIERPNSITTIINDVAELIQDLGTKLKPTLTHLEILTGDINERGLINALLKEPAYTQSFQGIMANVSKVSSDLSTLSAQLRSSSPQIQSIIDDAQRSLNEVTGIVSGVQDFLGTTPGRTTTPGGGSGMIQHNQRGYP